MSDKLNSWIHPKDSDIRIRPKINTSGKDAYGVSYAVTVPSKISGAARIRKQFSEKSKAEEWAKNQWNGFQSQGKDFFESTSQERREFASVLPRLRERGISLSEAVEFALPRLRPSGGDRTFSEVIEEIKAEKLEMLKSGTLRENSEKAFRLRSQKVEDAFGASLVRDLTLDEVKDWIVSLDLAPRTKKNELNCLHEILLHSVARKYVKENVLDGLTRSDRSRLYGVDEDREPEILTPKEADRLIRAAQKHKNLDLMGAVTLGLFCGIRTEEIKKLKWKDIHLDEGFVTIGRDIAKKRSIRNVTLCDNSLKWLSLCPDKTGFVTRSDFFCDYDRRFNKLLRHAEFTEKIEKNGKTIEKVVWKKNAMRHSFGTYHFALHGDSIKTSNELGHKQGDGVLFAHYRALATKKQAEKYFGIVPPSNANKVVEFAS
jgi:integrase